MNLDDILSLIANTGFPIVVASYFIIRMEEKLDKLAETIAELGHTIESKMQ
ncbi:YvrJ family protein [Aedoeadaptatus urinae]|uniref:YvrJ family protein n=1 Tax=Aedoeadaptatus urinae TaxID=1871017 RepID=UPI001F3D0590|nr:YvrJ family protein [Peptoniphilus urinae]